VNGRKPPPVPRVPRPTPPKYHLDRDKTPIPGTYLDHGERKGGEPRQTRPPSLPPALKLGPLTYSAEKDAQRHADESRTRTYSAEEVEELVQREARARGQSAKMAAVAGLEQHERTDDRRSTRDRLIVGATSALGVATIGAVGLLLQTWLTTGAAAAEARSEERVTQAATKRVEALLAPLERFSERIDAEETRRARDVAELHQRIDRIPTANPDLVSAVRRGLSEAPGQK